MTKKLLSLLITAVLMLSVLTVPAMGADSESNADRLNALGLFKGTDTGYALEGTATRIHGLIMLIRLLGEEDDALNFTGESPFADIDAELYNRYAGYAFHKGYTSGTGLNTFTPDAPINFKDYVTFLLRALGYSDKNGDFSYDQCYYMAGLINLIDPDSAYTLSVTDATFYRADMVDLSVSALTTRMNNSDKTLAQSLIEKGVFDTAAAQGVNILSAQEPFVYTERDYSSTIKRVTDTYSLPSGKVTADVITVNLKNPAVRVKTAIANNTVGTSKPFSQIVAETDASVVINGNFFEAYAPVWYPVGHVMCDGSFVYGVSGMYSFGFTDNGNIKVGSPALFFNVRDDKTTWACYELNSASQTPDYSVLYTPAFGQSITTKCDAMIVTVENSVITDVKTVGSDTIVNIPQNGYLIFFGLNYTSTYYFTPPTVGASVTMTPELYTADKEGFTLDNVTNLVSGGPRLVKNGEIYTHLEAFYNEARFTTMATTRTAIGRNANGQLIIISTSKATIHQLRELMHTLGCIDAINLDGGGSTALAYEGQIVRSPGRNLTTTLQIFVD